MTISIAVEGVSDVGPVTRVIEDLGGKVSGVYGRKGKNSLLRSIPGYTEASKYSHWVCVVDLDADYGCVVEARREWMRNESPLVFAVADSEIESWLLADPVSFGRYIGVSASKVETKRHSRDAKEALLYLSSLSRRKSLREDIVRQSKDGAMTTGPLYALRLNEFAAEAWDWRRARQGSQSLNYFCERLEMMLD